MGLQVPDYSRVPLFYLGVNGRQWWFYYYYGDNPWYYTLESFAVNNYLNYKIKGIFSKSITFYG